MTINCIHTIACGAHVFSQMTVLYGCSFANVNKMRMNSFYIILCGQTKLALRMRVCSTFTTGTSGHGIILMLWTWLSSPPLGNRLGWNRRRPPSTTCQAACSTISWFSRSSYTEAAWGCASTCKAEMWCSHDGIPTHRGRWCPLVLIALSPRSPPMGQYFEQLWEWSLRTCDAMLARMPSALKWTQRLLLSLREIQCLIISYLAPF
jgi:hypothetical protein